MAITHLRMRLSGLFFGGPANWSVGVNFLGAGGVFPIGDADGAESKLASWSAAVRALNGGSIVPPDFLGLLSAQGSITALRCSAVGTDGKETAVSLIEFPAGIKGSGPVNQVAQASLCISLDTARPGASYRGRMYWPALGIGIGQDGKCPTTVANAVSTEAAQWLRDLGTAGATIFDPQLEPVVLSTVKNVGTPITRVRVGDRLDIQRRRADKENEAYSVTVVPD